MKRIHLAAPGGGAACGAHSLGQPNGTREVLASHLPQLVDCLKCKKTDRWQETVNPAQYKLRLFIEIDGKRVINPAFSEPKKKVVNE